MNEPVIEALELAVKARRMETLKKIRQYFDRPIELESENHFVKIRQLLKDYDDSIKPIMEHINALKAAK